MSKKAKKKRLQVPPTQAVPAFTAPKMPPEDILRNAASPQRRVRHLQTVDDVRAAFSLPVTLGAPKTEREKMDLAFDSVGGFQAITDSLAQHASDLGQFPMTSFVGYGVLQQIAQNGMIQNCIATVADDLTREWITITGGDETDPERIAELQDAQESRFGLRRVFRDAATMTGYMGGCFVYVDTAPDDPGLPLRICDFSAEIEKGSPIAFKIIDPVNVSPGEYNSNDPLRADFMQPLWWWVLGRKVHGSRLLRMVDNEPPTLLKPCYNFLGIPEAQILWDYVLHWNKVRVAAVDLMEKVSLLVVKTDCRNEFSTADGVAMMDARMAALQRYRDNNSVFLCDNEDDVVNLQTSIAGVSDMVRQSQEIIAAIRRVPAVKLFGISPSGFNATGESDIRNYYDYLKSQQEIRRPAIQKCLEAIQIVLWGKIDPSISFKFNELGGDDAASSAMTFSTRVNALSQLAAQQAISAEEVRQAVKADPNSGLEFIDDELPEPPEGDQEQLMTDDPTAALVEQMRGNAQKAPPAAPGVKGEGNGEI